MEKIGEKEINIVVALQYHSFLEPCTVGPMRSCTIRTRSLLDISYWSRVFGVAAPHAPENGWIAPFIEY